MRGLIALTLTAVALGAFATGADAAAPKGRPLGGVNLTYYCANTFGPNYISKLIGPTAGDWRCVLTKSRYGTPGKSISVQAACDLQYGRQGLIAYATNWNDPLSWRCYQSGRGSK